MRVLHLCCACAVLHGTPPHLWFCLKGFTRTAAPATAVDIDVAVPAATAGRAYHREMGHIQQLPQLLHFTPPPPASASAAASAAAGMLGSAGQLGAAAGAAAAAAGSAVGAAVAAAGGAGAAAWPQQVAANYLCVLETAGLLLAAPCSANEEQRAQVGDAAVCLEVGVSAWRLCSVLRAVQAKVSMWGGCCWLHCTCHAPTS